MIRLRTGGERLSQKLMELIEKHDNIAFAVAWANHKNEAYKALVRNKKKISYAVIGTHFYQTHPDVLKCFIGCNEVRFVLQPQGIFHPKAYLFWSKKSWDMLVGSANLTSGALGENEELLLHISGDTRSGVQMDLRDKIEAYWSILGEVVTAKSESTYRKLWGERQPDLKCISGPSAKSESTYRKPRKKRQSRPWQPLSKLEVKTGSHKNPTPPPVEVRFPDDSVGQKTKSPRKSEPSWRGLLFQVTRWLVNKGHLTPEHCPIKEGPQSKYALVSTERGDLSETGYSFQVGQFHLQVSRDSSRIVNATRRIIRKVGQDPKQFKVRFSPPRT